MNVVRIGPNHFAVDLPEGRAVFCLDKSGLTVRHESTAETGRTLMHKSHKDWPQLLDVAAGQLNMNL